MENATKALVMAGAVLIAMLILGVLIYMFGSAGKIEESRNEKEELKKISAFNKEYESYQKKLMYGTDVISVINKSISNDETNKDPIGRIDSELSVKVEFTIIKDLSDNSRPVNKKYTYYEGNLGEYKSIMQNAEKFENLKVKVFECSNIEYENGRVSYISFTEVDTSIR